MRLCQYFIKALKLYAVGVTPSVFQRSGEIPGTCAPTAEKETGDYLHGLLPLQRTHLQGANQVLIPADSSKFKKPLGGKSPSCRRIIR